MRASDAAFDGSVPAWYHDHLGPLLFEPYARDLVRRMPKTPGARILELACGTGILTAELVSSFDEATRVTAVDLNDGMIAVARSHFTSPLVQWRTADAMALPFADRTFDVAACQFGVMFFPDRVAAAHEVHRVLRIGGPWWFNVWDTFAVNPLSRIAHETICGFFASDPPAFYERPFSYTDVRQITSDLKHGGFSEVAIETVHLEARAPSAIHVAVGYVQGNPVAHMIDDRGSVTVEEVTRAVASALEREFGRGEIRAPMRAHVVCAW
jgi:SAM-dependent methyltransferase